MSTDDLGTLARQRWYEERKGSPHSRPGALEASLRAFLGGERDDDPHFDERRVLADYAQREG